MCFEFLLCKTLNSVENISQNILDDCFNCHCQQITTAEAKESLIFYNLTQRAPKTQYF